MPRHKNPDCPDQDKHDTNPGRFNIAITEKTEQRIGHKNEPGHRGELNQCEKVVSVTVSHEDPIDQRSGNQGAAYGSTRKCKTA